jgi:hippurate hydrolase
MLEKVPGCYLFIGNGAGEGVCMVHNPSYDFNDEILPIGATYFSRLVETVLAA